MAARILLAECAGLTLVCLMTLCVAATLHALWEGLVLALLTMICLAVTLHEERASMVSAHVLVLGAMAIHAAWLIAKALAWRHARRCDRESSLAEVEPLMTEEEWQSTTDPMAMLEFVRGRASGRKLRLLGVAIARASWDRLEDERSRRGVEMAEQFADGLVDVAALEAVSGDTWDVRDELWDGGVRDLDGPLDAAQAAGFTASVYEWNNSFNRPGPLEDYPWDHGPPAHCALIREIFGRLPDRPIMACDVGWLTPAVVAIASEIYQARAFDRMQVMADALEDAGCDDADLIAHCRSGGPHFRGCWAVDRILGKS